MTAYLVSDLVTDCLTKLAGTAHDDINLLASSMSVSTPDAVDTLTLQFETSGAIPGVYLSIDDEAMLVVNTVSVTRTVTVLRGQKGSAAVTHSSNDVVVVDPPWPRWTVMNELRSVIRSMGPQVFSVQTLDIPLANGILGYDLGAIGPFFRGLDARQTAPSQVADITSDLDQASTVAPNHEWPELEYQVLNGNAPTTDFPSANAIIFSTRNLTIPGIAHFTYAAPFDVDTAFTDTTDCIADIGMDTSDLDIPAYEVTARLMRFRTPRRLTTQIAGQPRDAQEVPALALMQAADEMHNTYVQRIYDAQARLLVRFPMRMRFG